MKYYLFINRRKCNYCKKIGTNFFLYFQKITFFKIEDQTLDSRHQNHQPFQDFFYNFMIFQFESEVIFGTYSIKERHKECNIQILVIFLFVTLRIHLQQKKLFLFLNNLCNQRYKYHHPSSIEEKQQNYVYCLIGKCIIYGNLQSNCPA